MSSGRPISFRPREGTPPKPIEIVGVVADVVQVSLRDPAPRTLYTLLEQEPEPTPWMMVTIRTSGDDAPRWPRRFAPRSAS